MCHLFFSLSILAAVIIRWRINNIAKWANSVNNGASDIECVSLDKDDDSEHNSDGVVEIIWIFTAQGAFFFWTKPFGKLFLDVFSTPQDYGG